MDKEIDYQAMADIIARHGRQIMCIRGALKKPPFAYTIGNQEKNLPEFLIIGSFPPQTCSSVLNLLSEYLIEHKTKFTHGELTNALGGAYPVKIIDAKDPIVKLSYTVQAGQFYKSQDYEVQQVVVPDPNGRWPEDPSCHKDFRVPILSHPSLIISS